MDKSQYTSITTCIYIYKRGHVYVGVRCRLKARISRFQACVYTITHDSNKKPPTGLVEGLGNLYDQTFPTGQYGLLYELTIFRRSNQDRLHRRAIAL